MDRNSHTGGNGGGEFAHVEKNPVGVRAFLISHTPRFADMVCKYLMCVIFWKHRCFFSVDVLDMGDEQHQITIMCVQYEFIAFFCVGGLYCKTGFAYMTEAISSSTRFVGYTILYQLFSTKIFPTKTLSKVQFRRFSQLTLTF